jgi:hypothetical protein
VGLFIVKQIGRRPAQPQFSQIVDDIYLFKSALELDLRLVSAGLSWLSDIHAAREKVVLVHFIKAFAQILEYPK